MASMTGWACVAGTVVASPMRTLTYARLGLAGPRFNVQVDSCYCHALVEGSYISPSADPAPWYVAGNADSADFLGIYLDKVTLDSPHARRANRSTSIGGTISPFSLGPRVLACEGFLLAANARGLDYGQRWLYDALLPMCTDLADVMVLPACPEFGNAEIEEESFRTLYDCALVDGPVFGARDTSGSCVIDSVGFQIASQLPYLHADQDLIATAQLDQGDSTCASYTTPAYPGDATTVIDITRIGQNSGVSRVITVDAYPSIPGDPCDPDKLNSCAHWHISELFRDEVLRIDSARKQVLLWDPSEKRWKSGWDRVSFDGLPAWIDIAPCTSACICVAFSTTQLGTEKTIRSDIYVIDRTL